MVKLKLARVLARTGGANWTDVVAANRRNEKVNTAENHDQDEIPVTMTLGGLREHDARVRRLALDEAVVIVEELALLDHETVIAALRRAMETRP